MARIHYLRRLRSAKLITADLSIDISAVRREARRRFRQRRGFINRFTGKERDSWRREMLHKTVQEVAKEARHQRHGVIYPVASKLVLKVRTPAETARLTELSVAMTYSPVSARGNDEYRRLAGEHQAISHAVFQRAYAAAIEMITGETNAPVMQAAE